MSDIVLSTEIELLDINLIYNEDDIVALKLLFLIEVERNDCFQRIKKQYQLPIKKDGFEFKGEKKFIF